MNTSPLAHTFKAPAKLNMFLHILGQRHDGYHQLQSVFQLIDLCDTIHLAVREDGRIVHNNPIPGVPAENDLMVRAAAMLKQLSGVKFGVTINIEKRIPMGGGLGGGSSDAATVLMALNRLWEIYYPKERLMEIGVSLGADVPFFIFGENAWVEGIGERLQSIPLKSRIFLVIKPPVHVPTIDIFKHKDLTRDTKPSKIAVFSRYDLSGEWLSGTEFHNDLQSVVTALYPEVLACLQWLNRYSPARMSGSGACVFAEFSSEQHAKQVLNDLPAHYVGYVVNTLSRHPFYTLPNEIS